MIHKELSDTQPNPGWGFICAECKHTWSDETKYVTYAPSTPCNRLKYSRGGYDRSEGSPKHIAPGPIFELRSFTDGTESCPSFELQEGSKCT